MINGKRLRDFCGLTNILNFRPRLFWIKKEKMHGFEFRYMITEGKNDIFWIHPIVSAVHLDRNVVLNNDEIQSIKELVPEDQKFVALVKNWDFVTEGNSIISYLGDDWVFAIDVNESNNTYSIERNPLLDRSVNIVSLIQTVSKAYRIAVGH